MGHIFLGEFTMNMMEILLGGQNNQAIKELARNFGIGEEQAQEAVKQLAPAVSRGLQREMSDEQHREQLIRALRGGNHQRYIDQPEILGRPETVEDGNGILGHIFGSKEVSRVVASEASARTGLAAGMMKKMLPVVAAMVMGSLGKKVLSGALGGGSSSAPASGGLMDMLSGFLDADHDGWVVDDLLGMAGKFLR